MLSIEIDSNDENKADSNNNPSTDSDDISSNQQNEETADRILGQNPIVGLQTEDMLKAVKTIWEQMLKQPQLILKYQLDYYNRLGKIISGISDIESPNGDKRFVDEAWKITRRYV